MRFSAPNSSDAMKNLLANKRYLLKFKSFLYVIDSAKSESKPARPGQEQWASNIQNRRQVQKMCAFHDRNESGTGMNQIITQCCQE